ncbi:hypothetical protein BASA81_015863 [Batrachochytrium salamandrivorans]|nr:hypothetical protein BASA81_015863 [Batrachochytrium salamandrivorans]
MDFVDVMSPEERNRSVLMAAAVIIALASSMGVQGVALCVLVCTVLSTRKPTNTSFHVMFESWFKQTLFPQMSQRLKQELAERSKQPNQSLFNSFRDSAHSFLLDKTTGVRAELAWTTFSTSFSPVYRDFFFFRTASVNMGGENEEPVFVVFVGVNLEWYLSPHMRLDFDSMSVLRMMEGDNSSRQ